MQTSNQEQAADSTADALKLANPNALYTPAQALVYWAGFGLHFKESTLAGWRSDGTNGIPYCRVGRKVYYKKSALDAFLASKGLGEGYQAAIQDQVRIIREPERKAITGMSRSACYRAMREGRFPAALRLTGNMIGWRSDDIEAWLAGLSKTGGAE